MKRNNVIWELTIQLKYIVIVHITSEHTPGNPNPALSHFY